MSDRYAVFGNPIAHSKSPLIHSAFAEQTHQDIHYEAILAPLDGFESCVQAFRQQGGRGGNVTVPFKLEAFALATRLSARAQDAQAVNTLRFDADGIFGDNTDGAGLVQDILHNLGLPLQHRTILLMGAGGAARGVIRPLLAQHPASLTLANRSPAKAEALQAHFPEIRISRYETLREPFDIIINATSSGLDNQMPPLPAAVFSPSTLAYDMLYARETPFMKFARNRGAQVADGLGMLVEQAAESFLIWRGIRPETRDIIRRLRQAA